MSMLKIKNQHGGWDEIVAIRGRDGAIQYTAGANIEITPDNVISAKGLENSVTREDVTEMINASVPQKVSDLPNDAGYITSESVPTKLSDLNNDTGYITSADVPKVPTKTSELTNDSGFVNSSAIPTKTSELTNDSNFATLNDIPTVPTKLSELTNDTGYLKSSDVGTGLLTINRNNVAIGTFNANETINKTVNIVVPTTTSELTNDAGFVNNSAISGTVEDILSNKGYITEETEPAFKASVAATITQGNIDSWNLKQNALSISVRYDGEASPIVSEQDIAESMSTLGYYSALKSQFFEIKPINNHGIPTNRLLHIGVYNGQAAIALGSSFDGIGIGFETYDEFKASNTRIVEGEGTTHQLDLIVFAETKIPKTIGNNNIYLHVFNKNKEYSWRLGRTTLISCLGLDAGGSGNQGDDTYITPGECITLYSSEGSIRIMTTLYYKEETDYYNIMLCADPRFNDSRLVGSTADLYTLKTSNCVQTYNTSTNKSVGELLPRLDTSGTYLTGLEIVELDWNAGSN